MKTLLINIAALICAVVIFGISVLYSATKLPNIKSVKALEKPVVQNSYDDFLQEDDLLIADLLGENDSASSKDESFNTYTYSEPPSSAKPSSAKPSSAKPSSAKPSSAKPSSAKPSSTKPSSEQLSSQDPSSEEASTPITGDYAEILDMLAGAVQREIVGTNTNPHPQYYEAYKAQAVACHSYMEYHKARTGSYPTMSYSTPKQQTTELVAQVLNELIYCNGAVINASYHAASGGHTQSAAYVWGNSISYLTGVESAYDDYEKQNVISITDVENKLLSYGISVYGDASSWFELSGATLTDGGFVEYITICGTSVKGRELREKILGVQNLKSPKITDITVSGDCFIFTTKGYGHGVGLSQQGALGYAANDGWDYKQILTHYFQGTTVQ